MSCMMQMAPGPKTYPTGAGARAGHSCTKRLESQAWCCCKQSCTTHVSSAESFTNRLLSQQQLGHITQMYKGHQIEVGSQVLVA